MREFGGGHGNSHPVVRAVGWMFTRVGRWKPVGAPPDLPKFLVVVAPHTSNWDFPFMLGLAFYFNLRVFWMGKDSIFIWPFRRVLEWLGGIPIDRSKPNGMVEGAIAAFKRHERLVIAILPEGTRKRTDHWKSGFYHIAMGAGVPMVLAFADYRRREGGFGPVITPTGDIEADMARIAEFYKDIQGRRPENQAPVRLRPRADVTPEDR